jgi:hypothetical protein
LRNPGDLDLLRDLPVRAFEVLVHLVRRDLDGELDGVLVGLFEGRLHGFPSVTERSIRYRAPRARSEPAPGGPVVEPTGGKAFDEELAFAHELADLAGEIGLGFFRGTFEVTIKPDRHR